MNCDECKNYVPILRAVRKEEPTKPEPEIVMVSSGIWVMRCDKDDPIKVGDKVRNLVVAAVGFWQDYKEVILEAPASKPEWKPTVGEQCQGDGIDCNDSAGVWGGMQKVKVIADDGAKSIPLRIETEKGYKPWVTAEHLSPLPKEEEPQWKAGDWAYNITWGEITHITSVDSMCIKGTPISGPGEIGGAISSFRHLTPEHWTGRIGNRKLRVYVGKDENITFIYENEHRHWYHDQEVEVARVICRQNNVPIMPFSELQKQGGEMRRP